MDGAVTGADYTIWADNFSASDGGGAGGSVGVLGGPPTLPACGLGFEFAFVLVALIWRRRCFPVNRALLLSLVCLLPASAAWSWADISSNVTMSKTLRAFDHQNGLLFSYARVTNDGAEALAGAMRLVVVAPTVDVSNEDGLTGEAEAFFDLDPLAPGESTTIRVEFPFVRAFIDLELRLEQLQPALATPAITTAPSLQMNPNGGTPLAGLMTAATNVPTKVTLVADSGVDSFQVAFSEYTTTHSFPVLGLQADRSYDIDLTFTDQAENSIAAGTLQTTTGPLPEDFVNFEVRVHEPDLMEPGFTLLGDSEGYMIILDRDLNVVWYSTYPGSDARQLENGNLLWRGGNTNKQERDMLGNEVAKVTMQLDDRPEARLHHELFPTIYGTFLSLDREYVTVDGYPTSETDPDAPRGTDEIRDEPIVEFRGDGTPLKRWRLVDILDPGRVSSWSLSANEGVPQDTFHTNAIIHDPRDDSVIVSVRHQAAVIKVDRVTGRLKWILGPHANWSEEFQPRLLTPVGPLEWQYAQHAPQVTASGNLMLFDNGVERALPFDGNEPTPITESYSRAVEFEIDEESMEVRQVWEWPAAGQESIYSFFISDADELPDTRNVLITFGGTIYMGGVSTASLGYGEQVVRVVEVDHGTPAQPVMDLLLWKIKDPDVGTRLYRSEHIPSLYPRNAVQTKL